MLDALAERGEETIPLPDSGSLREDLRLFLCSTVDSANPVTRQLLSTIAAASAGDESMAILVRDRFITTRRAALGELLDRGVARGEITAADAALAVDFVYGSLWYRLIFHVGPLDYEWAESVAAAIAARRQDNVIGALA